MCVSHVDCRNVGEKVSSVEDLYRLFIRRMNTFARGMNKTLQVHATLYIASKYSVCVQYINPVQTPHRVSITFDSWNRCVFRVRSSQSRVFIKTLLSSPYYAGRTHFLVFITKKQTFVGYDYVIPCARADS